MAHLKIFFLMVEENITHSTNFSLGHFMVYSYVRNKKNSDKKLLNFKLEHRAAIIF